MFEGARGAPLHCETGLKLGKKCVWVNKRLTLSLTNGKKVKYGETFDPSLVYKPNFEKFQSEGFVSDKLTADEATKNISEMESLKRGYIQQIKDLKESSLEEKNALIEKYQSELEALEADHKISIAALEDRIAELNGASLTLDDVVKYLKESYPGVSKQITALEKAVAKADSSDPVDDVMSAAGGEN